MLHACVQIFDVMGTVVKFLGTKQGLNVTQAAANIEILPMGETCFF